MCCKSNKYWKNNFDEVIYNMQTKNRQLISFHIIQGKEQWRQILFPLIKINIKAVPNKEN